MFAKFLKLNRQLGGLNGRSRSVLVDVHHPLVDPRRITSPIRDFGARNGLMVIELDAFDLLHNLPAALGQLGMIEGLPAGPDGLDW